MCWSWIDSSRKREALTISCPGPGIASLRRCKAGPGPKIAKTTPCKVEWTPARSTLAARRPGQKKGPNLISSRSKPSGRVEFVMPGHSSLACADCVNLSAMPGIHVLAAPKQERRGWPGRSPAMTRKACHLCICLMRKQRWRRAQVKSFAGGIYPAHRLPDRKQPLIWRHERFRRRSWRRRSPARSRA
jgi:hypothetical protein